MKYVAEQVLVDAQWDAIAEWFPAVRDGVVARSPLSGRSSRASCTGIGVGSPGATFRSVRPLAYDLDSASAAGG
jgi:hypothetical protein